MNDDNLTNRALGDALGVSHAQASRFRSGDRTPSDLVMLKVATLMDWSVEEQIRAKYAQLESKKTEDGAYAVEFRRREPIALHRLGVASQAAVDPLEEGGEDE